MKKATFITELNGFTPECEYNKTSQTVLEHEIEVRLENGELINLTIDIEISFTEYEHICGGTGNEVSSVDVNILESFGAEFNEIQLNKTEKKEMEYFLEKNLA